jgi:hypothetical protein
MAEIIRLRSWLPEAANFDPAGSFLAVITTPHVARPVSAPTRAAKWLLTTSDVAVESSLFGVSFELRSLRASESPGLTATGFRRILRETVLGEVEA